jgi:Ca-activated chloride channel family protein
MGPNRRSDRLGIDVFIARQEMDGSCDPVYMEINTKLDFNLIAVEQQETVHLLFELTAPELTGERKREPASLQIVLDRSGSMGGGSLASALQAIDSVLARLGPEDRVGLVVFDDQIQVPIPRGELRDPYRARAALRQILPGGMTNLAGGLLRGFQEAQRDANGTGTTLVLLSDGHANEGITDHKRLEEAAAGARDAGISTSTVGIGLGYDEDLLAAIARGGSGNAHFAEHGDDAGAHLGSEVDGLLEQSIQAASLTVKPGESVSGVRLFNDLPVSEIASGFMVELGDLTGGETRRLLLEIDVPAIAELGLAQVAELELRWVEVESMKSKVVTLPVNVNVVPGDQAAGRIRDPEVETELIFQRAQRSKREATEALQGGDLASAKALYSRAAGDLRRRSGRGDLSELAVGELAEEAALLEGLATEAESDALRASKLALADHHMKARKRGRGRHE